MRRKPPLPSAGIAFVLFLGAAVLNVVVSFALFHVSKDLGILVSEVVAVLLPTVLLAHMLAFDVKTTFRLEWPTLLDVALALPLAASLSVINDQLSNLTGQVYPMPEEYQRSIIALLRASTPYEWIVRVLGVGLSAAVSEEFLFRGFIQTGLGQKLSRWPAILLTSVLFAVMHLLPWGFLGYILAGIVLSVAALATRSLLVPILVHFFNNAGAIVLINVADVETLGDPVWTPIEILGPAILIFLIIMAYFGRQLSAESAAHRVD